MTIFAGIAEFERDLIRERTGAGREAAKKRGVRFGRPRKLTLDQGEVARRLVSEGKAVREIAYLPKDRLRQAKSIGQFLRLPHLIHIGPWSTRGQLRKRKFTYASAPGDCAKSKRGKSSTVKE